MYISRQMLGSKLKEWWNGTYWGEVENAIEVDMPTSYSLMNEMKGAYFFTSDENISSYLKNSDSKP